jgi:hydroxymethylpyrimidine pyrophosphatase-like HAD family hydrolase
MKKSFFELNEWINQEFEMEDRTRVESYINERNISSGFVVTLYKKDYDKKDYKEILKWLKKRKKQYIKYCNDEYVFNDKKFALEFFLTFA